MITLKHHGNNENTLIDNDGIIYSLANKLEGRGQEGYAAFYKSEGGKTILVKVDDPATCVMESSANFFAGSKKVIPSQLKNTAIYATVGVYTNQNQETKTISIQDKVIPINSSHDVISLDMVLYGKKRSPSTLFSEEFWHSEEIKKQLTNMLPTTQWQLAGSIFSSSIAGDESLHTGQFMGVRDEQKNLIGIIRIDLGARERCTIARNQKEYDPYNTSKEYQQQGQFYKNYISFLLSSEDVKRKYTLLWSLTEIDKTMEEKYVLTFTNAIIPLADDQKQLAYEGILKTINKGAKEQFIPSKQNLDENIIELIAHLAEIAKNRAESMNKIALDNLREIFNDNELLNQFINAYKSNDFNQIDNFISKLEQNPLGVENVKLISYVCDTAVLMSMNEDYQNKQSLYLEKLKKYQLTSAILQLPLSKQITDDVITFKKLIETISNKYDYTNNSKLLDTNVLWNELFIYGLQEQNTVIIEEVLKQQLDFTKFGTENNATNHSNENRTEGALLLAAQANDYNTLLKLLAKRNEQFFSKYNTVSQISKTIGSIDRKDKNHQNIFHHLFKNWENIPKEINKPELLKQLLELLVIEKQQSSGGTNIIASIFSQKNINNETPLHIILKNNKLQAFSDLLVVIDNLNKNMKLENFIDFTQEVNFEKNFLDYAYDQANIELFYDLIEIIKRGRQKELLSADQRNQLLCSQNSPLTDEEKNHVKKKTLKGKQSNLLSYMMIGGKSGEPSFQYGITLWERKIKDRNPEPKSKRVINN